MWFPIFASSSDFLRVVENVICHICSNPLVILKRVLVVRCSLRHLAAWDEVIDLDNLGWGLKAHSLMQTWGNTRIVRLTRICRGTPLTPAWTGSSLLRAHFRSVSLIRSGGGCWNLYWSALPRPGLTRSSTVFAVGCYVAWHSPTTAQLGNHLLSVHSVYFLH